MKKIPDLREVPDIPIEIKDAALSGNLVLFVGAGASKLVGLPSWKDLAHKASNELCKKKLMNYAEFRQLKDLDPKKLLSIVFLIADNNGYDLDLTKYLKTEKSNPGIYKYLNGIGCVCVTTNYDECLEPQFLERDDSSSTAVPVKRIIKREEFYGGHLDEPGTVIHLHGSISDKRSMIITTKEYLENYDHKQVKQFLELLFKNKTVLFIGYGLEEAEILEHILRRGSASTSKRNIRKRFALQGYYTNEKSLYEKLHEYYEKSFGVHILGFIKDHRDHHQLEEIFKSWASEIEVKKPPLSDDLHFMEEVLENE